MQASDRMESRVNVELLNAAIRFNALILGLIGGSLGAITIYAFTQVSVSRWGSDAGSYLGLLAVFFPGYSVSAPGAWIGAFWAFVYAGIFASLSYWLYGQRLAARIRVLVSNVEHSENPLIKPSILRLHGTSLGLAIGATMSLGLFFSTVWLVVRGTAGESVHAALLSNYLPGYSVSILGGALGAIELFVVIFLTCLLLAAMYNKIVELRHE